MYRIYLQEKNGAKAEECKNFLIKNYPNSVLHLKLLIWNFANAVNAKKWSRGLLEHKPTKFMTSNYSQALGNCNSSFKKIFEGTITGQNLL